MTLCLGRPRYELPSRTENLQPRAVAFSGFLVVGRDEFSMRVVMHHVQRPVEIAFQLIVQVLRHEVGDKVKDQRGINGKHDDHGTGIGKSQTKSHAAWATQRTHGSPSRSMKPIPRMV